MRVLVYVHDLGVGGSQLNAIEIASELRSKGHDIIIYGRPGPLVKTIKNLDLEFVPAGEPGCRPSVRATRELVTIAKTRSVDILHGYEWPPALECYMAARRLERTVAVATVMSMRVAPFIPGHVPLAVGTELILERERRFGRTNIALIEPPVNTHSNAPGLELGQKEFRRRWGLEDGTYIVAIVSRLARQLKLEGILSAMEAVARLAPTVPVSLVIAGDGPAREIVQEYADEMNHRTGKPTVVLTGELPDPRPLYDIANICLGMGGSALRAMAFAKPLVVQGEGGFWELLTPSTLPTFLQQGWFGEGTDPAGGADKLCSLLKGLLSEEQRRQHLGDFGRRLVEERYSLSMAGERQLAIYADAVNPSDQGRLFLENALAAGRYAIYEARRRASRFMGLEASDDFNTRPLGGNRRSGKSQARSIQ
ncbi:glycosyltransferase [Pseudarthrobacter sp. LMD1-1-1.1]|uniref:glycosyltransferase n=1 Tax=Pseudarthrobacter sp. LMD1-1-1.1 TaxID=3135242 RepID=UPI0034192275